MKLFHFLRERYHVRLVRIYGKRCAKAMLTSALAVREYYKPIAPATAWVARKMLGRRSGWKQLRGRVFVYEMGPNSDGHLQNPSKYDGLVNGTLDITDDKYLRDVIQDVIRTELFWNYLRGLETWKRLELTDLALAEAAKIIGAPQAAEAETATAA